MALLRGTSAAVKHWQKAAFTSGSFFVLTQFIPADVQITTQGIPTPTVSCNTPLPQGLAFVDNGDGTGTISGTPTVSGFYVLTMETVNKSTTLDNTILLGIGPGVTTLAPTFTCRNVVSVTQAHAASFTLTTTGTPTPTITLIYGSLPPGMTLTSGVLSGTPTTPGTYGCLFKAANGVTPDATILVTVTVAPNLIPPTFTVGAGYQLVYPNVTVAIPIAATGSPTPALSVTGTLPSGLTFTDHGDGTGAITGVTTDAGVGVTLTANNGVSPNASAACGIVVLHTDSLAADPSSAILALTSGETWDGGGQYYLTPAGVWWFTDNVTVQNAIFVNPFSGYCNAVGASGNVLTLPSLDQIATPARIATALSLGVQILPQTLTGPGITANGGQVVIGAVDTENKKITLVAQNGATIGTLSPTGNYLLVSASRQTANGPNGRPQYVSVKPLVRVQQCANPTIHNITAIGGNGGNKGYHASLVGQHGFQFLSVSGLTRSGCKAVNVLGDGTTFLLTQGSDYCRNATDTGFTSDTPGRMGMTPGALVGATITDYTSLNATEEGVDVEEDVGQPTFGISGGNLTYTNYTGSGGSPIRVIAPISGFVTFNNINSDGYIAVQDAASLSGQTVLINGGTLNVNGIYSGLPGSPILIRSLPVTGYTGPQEPATLHIKNVNIVAPGRIPSPLYRADMGGILVLEGCTLNGSAITSDLGVDNSDQQTPASITGNLLQFAHGGSFPRGATGPNNGGFYQFVTGPGLTGKWAVVGTDPVNYTVTIAPQGGTGAPTAGQFTFGQGSVTII